MNLERIWTQNLGRDEQIMSWFFGEVRYPILDMEDWRLEGELEEVLHSQIYHQEKTQTIMNVQTLKRIKVVRKYLPMGSGSMESILMSYSNLSYVQPSQFKDYITQVRGSDLGRTPTVLTNLMDSWKCYRPRSDDILAKDSNRTKAWTFELLIERYPGLNFRAEASLTNLIDYRAYHDHCERDESPVYLFDH
ncbi:hypothetical protein BY996DRAFT_6583624 [Phakopsora pachyrhizi]|nr:hypothetical protein BY996DRAFT_6583624 [Phakopsora pachyrhizi]